MAAYPQGPPVAPPVAPPTPAPTGPPTPPPRQGATPTRQDLEDMIRVLSKEYNVDPDLALSITEVESNFQPNARSKKDARGLMQVMPATAKQYGVTNPDDLDDPVVNIRTAMQYLQALDRENPRAPTTVARRYVGSPQLPPEKSDFYVRRVFDIYRRRTGLPPDTKNEDTDGRAPKLPVPSDPNDIDPVRGRAPGAPGLSAAPPYWSWAAHPTLGWLAESLDPHERMGRQNIAGGVGSVGGGFAGGAAGAGFGAGAGTLLAGPGGGTVAGLTGGAVWGRRIGSAVGAAAGGALEQGLVEETGLGGAISSLPLGTQNDTSGPPPGSTPTSRIVGAAANQGMSDVAGQAMMWPVRIVGKRLGQSYVAKYALEKLEDMRAAAAAAFSDTKTVLGQRVRAAQLARTDATAELAADIARRREALRVDLLTRKTRPARTALQATKDAAAAEHARLTGEYDPLIAEARERAASALGGAKSAREAALDAERAAHQAILEKSAPSAPAAGRAVADVFEDAAQKSRRALGAAIDEAAASGPVKDIRALKAEALRIQQAELLPRVFPNQQASGVVDAILAEPNVVSFDRLHALKKELQDSLRNVYDKASRTQMQGAVVHLTKQIRETLSGFAPYDLATKAYEDVIPQYTSQLAKTIRRSARTSPEDIAQLIDLNKPTQARFLTKLMTEAAAEGGDAAGGRKALENVQDVWFYKNVLEGSLETLGERLDTLKRNPDFLKSFLSDPRMKTLISRAEELAKSYPELDAYHQARIAATSLAGESGVASVEAAKAQALAAAQTGSTADIRKAAEAVTRATDEARATTASARAGHAAERTRLNRTHADLIEEARRAKETATSPRLDEVTQALENLQRSTLGSNLRSPAQVTADLINVVKHPLGSAYAGIGLARTLLGASDADMARYVIYAKQPVRTLTRMFVTSTTARAAPAIASQVPKATVGKKTDLYLTMPSDKKKDDR